MVNFIGTISENHKCSLCRKDHFWVARGFHTLRFFYIMTEVGKQADALQSPSASGVAKLVHQVTILESCWNKNVWEDFFLPGLSLVENMIYATSYDEHWWTTYGSNFQRKLLLPADNSLLEGTTSGVSSSRGCKGCRGSQALVEKALRRAEQVSLKTLSKLNRFFSCSYFPRSTDWSTQSTQCSNVFNMATDRRHLILMYTLCIRKFSSGGIF